MKRNVFLGGSRLKTPSETCIDSKKRSAFVATKFKMFANLWNWNYLTIVLFADRCDFVLQNLERLADGVDVSSWFRQIVSVQIHDFGHNHFRKISSIVWCSLPMWRMVQRTARLKIQTLCFLGVHRSEDWNRYHKMRSGSAKSPKLKFVYWFALIWSTS